VEQSTVPKILGDSKCGLNSIFCNYWSFEPDQKMVKQPGTKQTGKGLYNTGNSCYLNGTVQALNHTPALGNWLSSDSKHGEKCEKIAAEHDKCIICKMTILQEMQEKNISHQDHLTSPE
jgi:uncharacterized UBP type Zn finger protein